MKKAIRNLVCIIVWTTFPAMIQVSTVIAQEFVKSDFMVSDLTDYFYDAPQLSVNDTGDMVVVWETVGAGQIWFKKISSQGTLLSEKKLILSPYTTGGARVVHADSGNFMVIYSGHDGNKWSVYGQVYDSNGDETGDTLEVQRSTSEQINSYFMSLFADRNNQFGAFLPGFDSMIVEKISGTGEFVGNSIVLKPDVTYVFEQTGVMTRSGAFIMVWRDGLNGDIRGLRYSPEGIPIGEPFLVSQKEETSQLHSISMASDTSGNFAVVWRKDMDGTTDLYSQLFNAEGMSVGTNTRITDDQSTPNSISIKLSIDMDVDGKFVIAWSDIQSSDTSYIYLQQMDNQGERVGGNYRATSVNNVIAGSTSLPSQIDPVVKILRDTIYLVWVNYNQDVSNRQNIFANIQKWMVPDVSGIETDGYMPARIKCYPNPSAGIFTLSLDQEYTGQLEWEVYTVTGVLVRRNTGQRSGYNATIDLSEEPAGLYHLKIKGDTFTSTLPLIIIR